MKKHQFEEITWGISILIAIAAWGIGFKIVAFAFLVKSLIDLYCLIKAIREMNNGKIVITYNQNDMKVTYKEDKNETIWLLKQAIELLEKQSQ